MHYPGQRMAMGLFTVLVGSFLALNAQAAEGHGHGAPDETCR